jgi:hypothetical protein
MKNENTFLVTQKTCSCIIGVIKRDPECEKDVMLWSMRSGYVRTHAQQRTRKKDIRDENNFAESIRQVQGEIKQLIEIN